MLAVCTMVAHTTGVNMAVDHFVEELEISRTTVASVWACSLFVSASLVSFAGAALDKYGSRKLTLIVSVPYVIAVFGMGCVTNIYTLAICTIALRFLGAECLCLISTVTPNKWFVNKRG